MFKLCSDNFSINENDYEKMMIKLTEASCGLYTGWLKKSKLLTQYNSLLFCATLYMIKDIQLLNKQDAQLSQRDRAAGCVIVFAKSRRLELGDNILRTV